MNSLSRENAELVVSLCDRISQEADKFEELARQKLQRTQRDTKRLLELQSSLEIATNGCISASRNNSKSYSEGLEAQVEKLLELAEETWNEYMGLYRSHRQQQERLKAEEQSRQTEAAKHEIETLLSISKLFEQVETSYPELIEYSGSLGTTYERNSIPVLGLHLDPSRKVANTRLENLNHNSEPVVFVSYIIASDYVTIDSAVGLLATILHRYAAKDRQIIDILSYKTIWIIPVLNVDSAIFLYKYYAEKHFKTVIYKNRRADNYTNENKCGAHGTGVNLNKNFAMGFYYSADLTENFPCSSFYGGVKPLSEPETKGLDEFLDKVNPQLVVGLFGDGHMIGTPDLSVAPKSDDFAAQYIAWVQRFQVLNQLSGGLEMYDPIKHEKPSLQSKGGNLDEYLLYQKRFVPLSYYVGLEGSKGKFFPRKDEIVQILESDIPNLVYLSCLTGKYFDLRTLEETYCKNDQTCLPIPSDVPKHYYGVKLRVTELGTIASQSDASGVTLCIRIPDLKHFYLDLAFDKNKKKLAITALNTEAEKEPGFSVSCLDLGKFTSYSDKSVYLVLRQTIAPEKEQSSVEGNTTDWDMEIFIKGRPKCGSQSIQMSFELQFYMLQNASGLARGLVLGVTAFALIVVCLKLFCCRKVQGEIVSSSDPSDGSDIIEKPKGLSTSIEITSMDDEDPVRRVKARPSTDTQTIIED